MNEIVRDINYGRRLYERMRRREEKRRV